MANVGFFGGSSLFELGPPADVELFFGAVNLLAIPAHPSPNWSILTDRLFRRYLHLNELDAAQQLMDDTKEIFDSMPSLRIDWSNITSPKAVTRLDPHRQSLGQVFSKYFEAFAYCRESAEVFFKTWNEYQPLRIVISDMPAFMVEKSRSIKEYDVLEGVPFWRR